MSRCCSAPACAEKHSWGGIRLYWGSVQRSLNVPSLILWGQGQSTNCWSGLELSSSTGSFLVIKESAAPLWPDSDRKLYVSSAFPIILWTVINPFVFKLARVDLFFLDRYMEIWKKQHNISLGSMPSNTFRKHEKNWLFLLNEAQLGRLD